MTADDDYKLLKVGIGFTNMVERATKGSADLTRKEIKEGITFADDKPSNVTTFFVKAKSGLPAGTSGLTLLTTHRSSYW